jgi:hypothetical protein
VAVGSYSSSFFLFAAYLTNLLEVLSPSSCFLIILPSNIPCLRQENSAELRAIMRKHIGSSAWTGELDIILEGSSIYREEEAYLDTKEIR